MSGLTLGVGYVIFCHKIGGGTSVIIPSWEGRFFTSFNRGVVN